MSINMTRVNTFLAALGLCTTAAFSQTIAPAQPEMQERVRIETPIALQAITNLHITSLGRVIDNGSPYVPRNCNAIATFTDANFQGGNYNAQAGFSEGESFAVTYTIPASQWPIKINLAEAIFATSNASVQTTTKWAISFYQGNPQTGARIFLEAADDLILPYLRIGPGTAGVNLQFSIDSQDPDQIFIADNGSRQFSVAWTIIDHHQGPANPCLTSPPTCCNAFPVTDVSGLASGTNNWLMGLNCGSFGCPSNGGWARFSNLNVLCRPTGDVVTRVTWSSVSCQPGTGACCLPDGTCEVLSELDCSEREGVYRGEFTSCGSANCPTPTGACCLSNGNCLVLSPGNCTLVSGQYLGNDTACGPGGICPRGACCLPNGTCVGSQIQNDCLAQGGQFLGVGTTCAANACPTGRCCLPAGGCISATQIQCASQSGTWGGASTTCTGFTCPQPTGACCFGNNCLVLNSVNCALISNSTWAGPFTTCADFDSDGTADVCQTTPCPADFNGDGGVDGADVESFFIAWAAAESNADVNIDGGVDGQDVEYFFVRWAAGGC